MTQPTDPGRPYSVGVALRGHAAMEMRCADVRPGSGDWLQLVDVAPEALLEPHELPVDGAIVLNVHPTMLTGPLVVRRVIPRQQRPADPTVEDLTAPFAKQVEVYQDYAAAIPRADPAVEPLPDPLTDEALQAAAASIIQAAVGPDDTAGIVRVGAVHIPPDRAYHEAIEVDRAQLAAAGHQLVQSEFPTSRELVRAIPGFEVYAELAVQLVRERGVMIVPAELDGWLPPNGSTSTRLEWSVADVMPGLRVGDPIMVWTGGDMVPTVHLGIRTWEDIAAAQLLEPGQLPG